MGMDRLANTTTVSVDGFEVSEATHYHCVGPVLHKSTGPVSSADGRGSLDSLSSLGMGLEAEACPVYGF